VTAGAVVTVEKLERLVRKLFHAFHSLLRPAKFLAKYEALKSERPQAAT
jgi:hypothetical protein